MSKKAKLYLLVVINLFAWGYVGYRIYNALQGDGDVSFETTNTSIKKIEEVKKDDKIILSLNYADPFLKGGTFTKEYKNSSMSANHNPSVSKTEKLSSKASTPVAALDIKYIGLVKNSDKGTQMAMIDVNGKSYFVKKKDVVEGISIQEITSESIKLKKGKQVLTIRK